MADDSLAQIKDTVTSLIEEELLWEEEGPTKLPEGANLLRVLDSLGITTLISRLEEQYDISITNDLLVEENLESVGAVAALVRSRMGVQTS